jgi:hypothetical protein
MQGSKLANVDRKWKVMTGCRKRKLTLQVGCRKRKRTF